MDYRQDYLDRGYAVVRGVFSPAEIGELAAAFDRVHDAALSHPKSYRHKNVLFRTSRDLRLGRIVRLVQWPSYFDPRCSAIVPIRASVRFSRR
jgi:hypothetical protein